VEVLDLSPLLIWLLLLLVFGQDMSRLRNLKEVQLAKYEKVSNKKHESNDERVGELSGDQVRATGC